jgi:hypothetical protein
VDRVALPAMKRTLAVAARRGWVTQPVLDPEPFHRLPRRYLRAIEATASISVGTLVFISLFLGFLPPKQRPQTLENMAHLDGLPFTLMAAKTI